MKITKFDNNNSGFVLVTVIMLILAMTTLAVGVLGTIGSQGILGQSQVDVIKAELLAKGAGWLGYMNRVDPANIVAIPASETLDGKTFTITAVSQVGNGPSGTDTGIITVNF